jgi:hypothetical protein
MSDYDVTYCQICESKPGSPVLCPACLANRDAIYALRRDRDRLTKALAAIRAVLALVDTRLP